MAETLTGAEILIRTLHVVRRRHKSRHSEEQGLDKNFAGFFPFIDLAFCTFYMPAHQPTRFGIDGDDVPDGLAAQMLHPFRRLLRAPASAPSP